MMAGADEPATLSGLCQPMAIAMVTVSDGQSRIDVWRSLYTWAGCCCIVVVDG